MRPVKRALLKRNPRILEFAMRLDSSLNEKSRKVTCPERYEKSFYLEELGPVESFSDIEYACKEYRVLMPKMIHPYAKCSACSECDITGTCNGFHRDYAAFIGFDEAVPGKTGEKIYNPKHYMSRQMKVVEEAEYEWALQ